MPEAEIKAKASAVAIGADQQSVVVTSPELANALVHDQDAALAALGETAELTLADISLDALGRVVIENGEFAQQLKNRLQSESGEPNLICQHFNLACPHVDEPIQ
jgi:hypothetical protein